MTFDYKDYREQRYVDGGHSGKGSYGDNALFKAAIINKFIKNNGIKTVLEVGCGDGHNLGLYEVEEYCGTDVSDEALKMCREKFKGDKTKYFHPWTPQSVSRQFDCTLCLDVTYHIFPREERESTIKYVIDFASKYAIFYSFPHPTGHVKHINDYNFDKYIRELCFTNGYGLTVLDETPPDSQSRFYIIKK